MLSKMPEPGFKYNYYNNTILSPEGVPYHNLEVPKNININPDDYIYWDLGMPYWKDTRMFISNEYRYGALWEFNFDSPRGLRVVVTDTIIDEFDEIKVINRARTFYDDSSNEVSLCYKLINFLTRIFS